MDFNWIIYLLIIVLVLSLGFAIIKYLIMPAVAPAIQVWVWAIIGVVLLIMVLYFASQYMGHGYHSSWGRTP
jgi:hypothetical protein